MIRVKILSVPDTVVHTWNYEEDEKGEYLYWETLVIIKFQMNSPFAYGLKTIWRHVYTNTPLAGIVPLFYLKRLLVRKVIWKYYRMIMNLPGLYKELQISIWDWMKNILLYKKYEGIVFRL